MYHTFDVNVKFGTAFRVFKFFTKSLDAYKRDVSTHFAKALARCVSSITIVNQH